MELQSIGHQARPQERVGTFQRVHSGLEGSSWRSAGLPGRGWVGLLVGRIFPIKLRNCGLTSGNRTQLKLVLGVFLTTKTKPIQMTPVGIARAAFPSVIPVILHGLFVVGVPAPANVPPPRATVGHPNGIVNWGDQIERRTRTRREGDSRSRKRTLTRPSPVRSVGL